MIVLRSALFNILFYGYTTLTAFRMAPLLLRRDADVGPGVRHWAEGVHWLLEHLVGITYEVRGHKNIPEGPALVASKHQSAWDTITFHTFMAAPAYVMKKELTNLPLYGRFTQMAGSIVVDREAGAQAIKGLVRDCRASMATGHQIVIFPEGTRTTPGTRYPYQPGIAALYRQLDVAVVPVALNSGLFWGRHNFIKHPGRIVVEFLPPIQPGMDRRKFLVELEAQIEAATADLISEAIEDGSGDNSGGKPVDMSS
jgi:1-acyl-sn-glycerol-3-phosphate acyltransferase